MIDNTYRNSLQEVYIILQNTEDELLKKIPTSFMDFIKTNRNIDYKTNIKQEIELDKQSLLKETENILSLIYRSYWATDDEKKEFTQKDQTEAIEAEKKKKEEYSGRDIDAIFEERKESNKTSFDNSLMVIKKENFFQQLFHKIVRIFKK